MRSRRSTTDQAEPVVKAIVGQRTDDYRTGLALRACVWAEKKASNKELRQAGVMVDNGWLEVCNLRGDVMVIVWAIDRFFKPIKLQRSGLTSIGLAIAYCPEISILALASINDPLSTFSLELVIHTVRGIVEQGFCANCHTYTEPTDGVCSECGAHADVPPILQVL